MKKEHGHFLASLLPCLFQDAVAYGSEIHGIISFLSVAFC